MRPGQHEYALRQGTRWGGKLIERNCAKDGDQLAHVASVAMR